MQAGSNDQKRHRAANEKWIVSINNKDSRLLDLERNLELRRYLIITPFEMINQLKSLLLFTAASISAHTASRPRPVCDENAITFAPCNSVSITLRFFAS